MSETDDQTQRPDWANMTRKERDGAITQRLNEGIDLRTDQGMSDSLEASDDDDTNAEGVSLDDISGPGPGNPGDESASPNDSDNDNDRGENEQEGEGSEPSTLDGRIAQAEAEGDYETAVDLRLSDALGTLGGDAA